jgi:wyosine [tRNA(Phe)-imidazoG37] synthetase (radical SAM superfamily)
MHKKTVIKGLTPVARHFSITEFIEQINRRHEVKVHLLIHVPSEQETHSRKNDLSHAHNLF